MKQVIIYTLPNCPICNMVKTKLKNKNIAFLEKDFNEIINLVDTDLAPILDITQFKNPSEKEERVLLFSPSSIVSWIGRQE